MSDNTGLDHQDDSALDPEKVDDVRYLEELGYKQELRRGLGLFGAFAIQFSIIGVSLGLYLLFGYGLDTAGPFFIVAFIVGGLLQMTVGMSIAELVSVYPLAGGIYQIVSRLSSKVLAWQVAWWYLVAFVAAVAVEAVGLAPYVSPWFRIPNPDRLQTLGIAFVVIAFVTLVNVIGIRLISTMNNIGVLCEIFGLSTIVVLLLIHGVVHPLSFLGNTAGTSSHGWLLPFAFVMLMPAFIISAFDSTGHTGEETRNAAITAPKGVLIANFSALIYATIAIIILTLSIPSLSAALHSSVPIVYVVTARLGSAAATALTVVVVVSFIVNIQILELTGGRLVWAQARDGQMPLSGWLRFVSRRQTPANATVVVGVLSFLLCLYASALAVLAAMAALAEAVAFGVAVAVGIVAKHRHLLPRAPLHYGRWDTAVDGIAVAWSVVLGFILIYQNPSQVGLGFLGVIASGLVIYGLMRWSHSARRGTGPLPTPVPPAQ
jgi:amino acid transporter